MSKKNIQVIGNYQQFAHQNCNELWNNLRCDLKLDIVGPLTNTIGTHTWKNGSFCTLLLIELSNMEVTDTIILQVLFMLQ